MSGSGISTLQLCTEFVKPARHCDTLSSFESSGHGHPPLPTSHVSWAVRRRRCPASFRPLTGEYRGEMAGLLEALKMSRCQSSLLRGLHCALPCAAALQYSPRFILLSFVLGCAPGPLHFRNPFKEHRSYALFRGSRPGFRFASRRPRPPLSAPRLRGFQLAGRLKRLKAGYLILRLRTLPAWRNG